MNELQDRIKTLKQEINARDTAITQKQADLVCQISQCGSLALKALVDLLEERYNGQTPLKSIDGVIYETLLKSQDPRILDLIQTKFAQGIIKLTSAKNIDYTRLQQLLVHKKFLDADRLTQEKLCELSNSDCKKRQWLYFTDIYMLPKQDLQTIDTLWRIHSLDRFGFSIQKKIWQSSQKDWQELFSKIKWTVDGNLCRYPQEFIWDLTAPPGHLPLFNQLRGIQTFLALLSHEAWKKEIE